MTKLPSNYEQTLLKIIEKLPTFQRTQLLDYALLMESRLLSNSEAKAVDLGEAMTDAHLWQRVAIRSLAKEWDTPEEDEAWAYLQKVT
jgi:hypothetical protein